MCAPLRELHFSAPLLFPILVPADQEGGGRSVVGPCPRDLKFLSLEFHFHFSLSFPLWYFTQYINALGWTMWGDAVPPSPDLMDDNLTK